MSFKNECDLPIAANPAACSLPYTDFTVMFHELMFYMAEGKAVFDGETVKSLNHLKKLYSEWLKKQKD